MAHVVVRSWQETYRGLVPDDVLDDPGFLAARIQPWTAALTEDRSPQKRIAVAERGGRVIGVAMSGPPQDADAVWATQLYVLDVYADDHGTGAGAGLLDNVVPPTESAALWVGRPEPTRPGVLPQARLPSRWSKRRRSRDTSDTHGPRVAAGPPRSLRQLTVRREPGAGWRVVRPGLPYGDNVGGVSRPPGLDPGWCRRPSAARGASRGAVGSPDRPEAAVHIMRRTRRGAEWSVPGRRSEASAWPVPSPHRVAAKAPRRLDPVQLAALEVVDDVPCVPADAGQRLRGLGVQEVEPDEV